MWKIFKIWKFKMADDRNFEQESRAAARKPRDAASVLFRQSSPTLTTFTTSIRLAKLRKRPRFRAPNMLAQNAI